MKVFIVTSEGYPHGFAAAGRITCYAKALLIAGVEVEVVVYHRSEIFGTKAINTEKCGVYEGIPFCYIGGTPQRDKNLFIRKFHDWQDANNTINYLECNMQKGDIILCYFREDKFGRKLTAFAHKYGYHIIRDLCEYPYAVTTLNERTEQKCMQYMQTDFQRFDGAICISENLLNLAMQYAPHKHHIKIPILIDETKWDFSKVKPIFSEVPYIFHSGTLYQQKDGILDVLSAFADALPQLPQGTQYFFTGSIDKSPDRIAIKQIIAERNLENNVQFLGYLSQEDIRRYIKGASLFIINKLDNLQNRYCFATKLGEYLLSGKPVLTTDIGEAVNYLINSESAYIVKHGSIEKLSSTIVKALTDRKTNSEIGLNGSTVAINHFTCKAVSSNLKQYLNQLS